MTAEPRTVERAQVLMREMGHTRSTPRWNGTHDGGTREEDRVLVVQCDKCLRLMIWTSSEDDRRFGTALETRCDPDTVSKSIFDEAGDLEKAQATRREQDDLQRQKEALLNKSRSERDTARNK